MAGRSQQHETYRQSQYIAGKDRVIDGRLPVSRGVAHGNTIATQGLPETKRLPSDPPGGTDEEGISVLCVHGVVNRGVHDQQDANRADIGPERYERSSCASWP